MDFNNPLGIERRVVKNVTYEGQPARVVIGSRIFETDPSDLWDAVTNAERLEQWFLPVSGELELGGRYQLKGNAGGKIERCEPPETLLLTWEFGDNVSWVQLDLVPAGIGTRLTLEHIMQQDADSEAHWEKYGPGATGVGWECGFLGLGMHIKTGETIVQEEIYAWMATTEGKDFIRSCAAGWEAAHIDSGEEAAVAKAMAEFTAKFYCGEM